MRELPRKFSSIYIALTILPVHLFYIVELVVLIMLLYVNMFVTVQLLSRPSA